MQALLQTLRLAELYHSTEEKSISYAHMRNIATLYSSKTCKFSQMAVRRALGLYTVCGRADGATDAAPSPARCALGRRSQAHAQTDKQNKTERKRGGYATLGSSFIISGLTCPIYSPSTHHPKLSRMSSFLSSNPYGHTISSSMMSVTKY